MNCQFIEKMSDNLYEKIESYYLAHPEYEFYYNECSHNNLKQYAGYELTPDGEAKLISFLSFLKDDDNRLLELSGFTIEDSRNKGFFNELYSYACADMKSTQKISLDYQVCCLLPSELTNISSLSSGSVNELLMEITASEYLAIQEKLEEKIRHFNNYEMLQAMTAFINNDETNEGEYLLYEDEANDEPCAVASYSSENNCSNIYGVYVDKDKRNKKIAFYMLKNLLDYLFTDQISDKQSQDQSALRTGNRKIILTVKDCNLPALSLYKSLGFKVKAKAEFSLIKF